MTDEPDASPHTAPLPIDETGDARADAKRRPRRIVTILTLLLALVGLGVFIAPFAFPIHPPVVQGIRSTVAFSPTAAVGGGTARISFKMNEPATITVAIVDPSDRGGKVRATVKQGAVKQGRLTLKWDGKDDAGTLLPDGRYIVNIKARANTRSWSGKQRSWNSNRAILVDTTPPKLAQLRVQSAIATGAKGACQVQATAAEAGTLMIEAIPAPGSGRALATRAPAPVGKNATAKWSWDGIAKGSPAPPGLYVIRTTLSDKLANAAHAIGTCWVSHGGGAIIPSSPKRGDAVRVQLTGDDGAVLGPSTPVTLTLARRNGDLGTSALDVVGGSVGGTARGPMSQTKLILPRKLALDNLWLVATTAGRRVVIPLRP